MFADVVRSMDIARTVGPERLSEIMAELMRRSSGVIRGYGGVVNQFTGDGLMAVFGAPHALEDHAVLACRAALRVVEEVRHQAVEVLGRDGIDLQLRVGLNSGQVIAGEIRSGVLGYTTFGEEVGMAQRMESVAPAGGVMLSAATARLVENCAILGGPEHVPIKGRNAPIPVRRLLAVPTDRSRRQAGQEPPLTGRADELAVMIALLDRALATHGLVGRVVGPAGIGKTRLVTEIVDVAASRALPVYITYCESHTRNLSFSAAARLLRAVLAVTDAPADRARSRVRSALPDADADDLLLLDDLLGVRDQATAPPDVSPEARRRRLTEVVKGILLQRRSGLYVIEDAHWIDEASESLLVDVADVLPKTRSLVLVTHRPEYRGALSRIASGEAVALGPLSDMHVDALTSELLGADASVQRIAHQIVEKASGNPLFVTEIVRDLAQRGVLQGRRGHYRSIGEQRDIAVPATLQATIAARIDRLPTPVKSVLYAAAVIGTRFGPDLLRAVVDDDELVTGAIVVLQEAELVDRVSSLSWVEFTFRHPLIHAVAYESQLKAVRNDMHRRVAAAIERANSTDPEQHAALIAEHLHAAGDLRVAFEWHMRAGRWLSHRDRAAAWENWRCARRAAEALPDGDTERTALLSSALTQLCSESWRTGGNLDDAGLGELRTLCETSGDRRSLAISLAGIIMALTGQHRHSEAIGLIPELTARIRALRDPVLGCALWLAVAYARSEVGQLREALRLAQTVIDLSDGDLTRGNLLFSSPLVSAMRMRGLYRLCLGVDGWRSDGDAAIAMAHDLDPTSRVSSVLYKYILSIPVGARRVDEVALQETAAALRLAEHAGDELTLTTARVARGLVLVYGNDPGEEAVDLLTKAREATNRRRFTMNAMALAEPALARCMAQRADLSGAIDSARGAISDMLTAGEVLSLGVATSVLVESLVKRAGDGDLAEATAAVDRLAAVAVDPGFVLYDVSLLRLRALLAEAVGDDAVSHEYMKRARAAAAASNYEVPQTTTEIFASLR
ncbi:hypothetical protein ASJ79_07650 [Mycobacterium sp. NAZ190054]|nr:hypothetical protein ASJ79_07650 [Mycobacterium sp. NAZ190054]